MSSSLCWKPKQKSLGTLPFELKQVLLKSEFHRPPKTFDGNDLSYLRGLRDAGVKGAEQLIDLINIHGEVEVWESY